MKPTKVATVSGMTLGHYMHEDLVSIQIHGRREEILLPIKYWRHLVRMWEKFDTANQSLEGPLPQRSPST